MNDKMNAWFCSQVHYGLIDRDKLNIYLLFDNLLNL